jgi:hypothetical protein
MKKLVTLLFFLCVITNAFAYGAYAGVAPQRPWEIVFSRSNKIFYMTPRWLMPDQLVDEERMQIKSGLYYNETPLVNIYNINEYFYEGTVSFSSDGIYFVNVVGVVPGSFDNLSGVALSFYANGSLIKSYQVRNLLKDRNKADFSSEGVHWLEKRSFDQQTNILTVITRDERIFTFDIETGVIISEPSELVNNKSNEMTTLCVFIGVLTVFTFLFIRTILSRK